MIIRLSQGGSPTEGTFPKDCSTFIPAIQRHMINFSRIPSAQVTEVSLLLTLSLLSGQPTALSWKNNGNGVVGFHFSLLAIFICFESL